MKSFPFTGILSKLAVCVFVSVACCFASCGNKNPENKQVAVPEEMNTVVQDGLKAMLAAADETGKINDSVKLKCLTVVKFYYAANDYIPVWSSEEKWAPFTTSFYTYLDSCERDGLLPQAYGINTLKKYQAILTDSVARTHSANWANVELLLSDAFFNILQDLKQGRLQADSSAWKYNKEKQEHFFSAALKKLQAGQSVNEIFQQAQPTLAPYLALRKAVPSFVDSMDRKSYTYLYYPNKDSLAFQKRLLKRLAESGFTIANEKPDSAMLSDVITRYQKARKIKVTGKLSAALVKQLNNTDAEKFKRIAVTLDRYKQLPESLPQKYIWVNIPSYQLKVWSADTLIMESRVVVGKSGTPTPFINSAISDIIVYPTWTIPNSIIVKEILPALKRNPGYLARKGYGLYTYDGKAVDPYSVNWAKYSKGIPYMVRQGSGDNNALGVIKFNFPNSHSVYLHDTNQRYLFKNSDRSLSHGCVRVQNWEKLATFIVRNDSIEFKGPDSLRLSADSITSWVKKKERHIMPIKSRMPVFIRYFSVEGTKEGIKFYDDIYGDDKKLRERYLTQN